MDLIKYFTFSMIISISGIRGILLNRRNIPIMSMQIEAKVTRSEYELFAIFVITFRVRGTIAVEFTNNIQGYTPVEELQKIKLPFLPSSESLPIG
ncbi:hypothetical protein MKX03_004250 [Papaver bracteatum]|nr:hypothetical protein MKX03_004250 [Papaver bracteatum]